MMRILAWPAFKNRLKNPYNSLLYGPMAKLGVEVDEFAPARLLRPGYAVWHMHWPEDCLIYSSLAKCAAKFAGMLALLDLAGLKGVKRVWTVHNLHSHEGLYPRLEHWFWPAFTRRLDGYISLSETGRQAALERHPALRKLPGFIVPHGHYRDVYPNDVGREEARCRLGLPPEATVLVHLGAIRPYKNLPHLIRTFRLTEDPSLVLLVAGRPFGGPRSSYAQELAAEATGDPRIRLLLDYVPAEDLQLYFRAADITVLPYQEVLNSGSALLSLSFDCPVLIPPLGAMQELQGQVGREWVRTYAGSLTPDILRESVCWARQARRSEKAPLDALDWNRLAASLVNAYGRICRGETV